MGIVWAFNFFIITYIVLAGTYAWDWAIEISDWFVFLIIRIIVVIILTIPSLFIIPFEEDIEIILIAKIPILIGLGIGLLYGFSEGVKKNKKLLKRDNNR